VVQGRAARAEVGVARDIGDPAAVGEPDAEPGDLGRVIAGRCL
jgi:hypothetical protein